MDLTGSHQDPGTRHRQAPVLHRRSRGGHRGKPPRHPDLVAGTAPAQAAAVHEPGGDRQVPVVGEGAPTLDLAHPAQALELEQLGGTLQLHQVLLDPRVRQIAHHLSP